MSEQGRKYQMTMTSLWMGMAAYTLYILAGYLKVPVSPESFFTFMGAAVLSFNGANAVVSWGYSRTSNQASDPKVTERRDVASGVEPAP